MTAIKDMVNTFVQYLKDSREELKKVVWPTKKEVRNHTVMVIAISLVVAAFLGALDFGLNKLIEIFVF